VPDLSARLADDRVGRRPDTRLPAPFPFGPLRRQLAYLPTTHLSGPIPSGSTSVRPDETNHRSGRLTPAAADPAIRTFRRPLPPGNRVGHRGRDTTVPTRGPFGRPHLTSLPRTRTEEKCTPTARSSNRLSSGQPATHGNPAAQPQVVAAAGRLDGEGPTPRWSTATSPPPVPTLDPRLFAGRALRDATEGPRRRCSKSVCGDRLRVPAAC